MLPRPAACTAGPRVASPARRAAAQAARWRRPRTACGLRAAAARAPNRCRCTHRARTAGGLAPLLLVLAVLGAGVAHVLAAARARRAALLLGLASCRLPRAALAASSGCLLLDLLPLPPGVYRRRLVQGGHAHTPALADLHDGAICRGPVCCCRGCRLLVLVLLLLLRLGHNNCNKPAERLAISQGWNNLSPSARGLSRRCVTPSPCRLARLPWPSSGRRRCRT
jgi:hypothetical protein